MREPLWVWVVSDANKWVTLGIRLHASSQRLVSSVYFAELGWVSVNGPLTCSRCQGCVQWIFTQKCCQWALNEVRLQKKQLWLCHYFIKLSIQFMSKWYFCNIFAYSIFFTFGTNIHLNLLNTVWLTDWKTGCERWVTVSIFVQNLRSHSRQKESLFQYKELPYLTYYSPSQALYLFRGLQVSVSKLSITHRTA